MGEMARTYPKEVACQPIKFSPSPYPAPLQRNRQPFFRRSHSALAPELHDKRLKRRFVHVGFWAAHVAGRAAIPEQLGIRHFAQMRSQGFQVIAETNSL